MTDTQAGLLPCPFCGHSDDIVRSDISEATWVLCRSCGASSGRYRSKERATEAWNTRPSPPASAEVVSGAQSFLEWNRKLTEPLVKIGFEYAVYNAALQAGAAVPNWTQMAQAMQRIGACGTEDEIASLLCNAAAPQKQGA